MEDITITTIITFTTLIVTYIFGILTKKFKWIESEYIPYQNALIGFVSGILAYKMGLIDNFASSIIMCEISAFGAGGGYDLLKKKEEENG